MSIKQAFHTPVQIFFSDVELMMNAERGPYGETYIIRKVKYVIMDELTRPFREVLGMKGLSRE